MNWEAIGAVATAGAALVALAVYLPTISQARRRQAEQVSAWLELVRDGDREGKFDAVLRNGSDEPLYDVSSLHVRPGIKAPRPYFFVAEVLPPHSEMRTATDIPIAFPGIDAYRKLDIQFRDAAGRHWIRRNGRLHRRCVREGERDAT